MIETKGSDVFRLHPSAFILAFSAIRSTLTSDVFFWRQVRCDEETLPAFIYHDAAGPTDIPKEIATKPKRLVLEVFVIPKRPAIKVEAIL